MAKKSFLVPVAVTVAAFAGAAGIANAAIAPNTSVAEPSQSNAPAFVPVGGLVLERADGSAVRLADHASHESHSSHSSHDSHSSHSSHSSGAF